MYKIAILFLFLLNGLSTNAQVNYGGLWQGNYSSNTSQKDVSVTEFYLHLTNDEKINGFGAFYKKNSGKDGDIFTKWRIQGVVTTEGVRYKVSSIYHNKGEEKICQTDCYLTHSEEGDFDVLTGKCYPTGYKFADDGSTLVRSENCKEISLKLYKKNEKSEVITEEEIAVLEKAYSNFDVTISDDKELPNKETETSISVAPTQITKQTPTEQNQTITFDIDSQKEAKQPTETKEIIGNVVQEIPKTNISEPSKQENKIVENKSNSSSTTSSRKSTKFKAKKYKTKKKKEPKFYKKSQRAYAKRAKKISSKCSKMK